MKKKSIMLQMHLYVNVILLFFFFIEFGGGGLHPFLMSNKHEECFISPLNCEININID